MLWIELTQCLQITDIADIKLPLSDSTNLANLHEAACLIIACPCTAPRGTHSVQCCHPEMPQPGEKMPHRTQGRPALPHSEEVPSIHLCLCKLPPCSSILRWPDFWCPWLHWNPDRCSGREGLIWHLWSGQHRQWEKPEQEPRIPGGVSGPNGACILTSTARVHWVSEGVTPRTSSRHSGANSHFVGLSQLSPTSSWALNEIMWSWLWLTA